MTTQEAIEVVVARTGHTRFRQLCDPSHPDYNPAYAATVVRIASGPHPAPPKAGPDVAAALAAVRSCPHRGGSLPVSEQPPGCKACELYRCAIGPPASTVECVRCVTGQSPRVPPEGVPPPPRAFG